MNYIKHLINTVMHMLGYHIARIESPYKYLFDHLEHLLRKNGKLTFIQIGANDGKSFDPIHEFVVAHRDAVSGVAVEPVPEYFEDLQKTYRDFPAIRLCNVAIHNTEKEMTIHRIADQYLKQAHSGARGIASFDADYHKKSKTPSEYCISETVQCMPLQQLLQEYEIGNVDLLQIDTEGYDSEIIRNIDFDKFQPTLIHFEHEMSSNVMTREQFCEVAACLNAAGYHVSVQKNDALAYRIEGII